MNISFPDIPLFLLSEFMMLFILWGGQVLRAHWVKCLLAINKCGGKAEEDKSETLASWGAVTAGGASDWSMQITWPEYWPLIGCHRRRGQNTRDRNWLGLTRSFLVELQVCISSVEKCTGWSKYFQNASYFHQMNGANWIFASIVWDLPAKVFLTMQVISRYD